MTHDAPAVTPPRLERVARLIGWIAAGGLLGAIVTLVIVRQWTSGNLLPTFDASVWRAGKERWQASDLRDYDIAIRVTGRQAATYAVEVRDGEAISATRDGQPLPQKRTWSTWTVDGMFETIARDLESVERHATGKADASTPQLVLRGSFHPTLGYPARYHRTEMVRMGANPEVSWEVISFVPLDENQRGAK